MEQQEVRDFALLAAEVFATCERANLQYVEGYIERTRQFSLEYSGQDNLRGNQRVEAGIGLRLYYDDRVAFFASSDLEASGVNANMGKIVELLKRRDQFPQEEPYVDGASCQLSKADPQTLDIFDPLIAGLNQEARMAHLRGMRETCAKLDKRFTTVLNNKLTTYDTAIYFFNSSGASSSYQSTMVTAFLACLGQEGDKVGLGFQGKLARHLAELKMDELCQQAVQQMAIGLEGVPVQDGNYDLVISPQVTGHLCNTIGEMLKADNYLAGQSLLSNLLDEKVAGDCFTLLHNGLLARGNGTVPFDGEGQPSTCQSLFERGRLVNLLHSSATARQMNTKPNGATKRYNFRTLPYISWSNLQVVGGVLDENELLKNVGNGIYLVNVIDFGNVNPVTGKFYVKCTGYQIKNGQLTQAVNPVFWLGQIKNILQRIALVGNNLQWSGSEGNILAPALLITDQTVIS